MKNDNIGFTLLFYSKSNNEGELLSFTNKIESNWISQKQKIFDIAVSYSKKSSTEFIGIEDVFFVDLSLKKASMLGKSYIYDVDRNQTNKMIASKNELLTKIKKSSENLVFSILYYYESEKLVISSLISFNQIERDTDLINQIIEIGKSDYFRKKVVSKSIDEIDYLELDFLGIECIYEVKDEFSTGCFLELYKENVNKNELLEMLPVEDVLRDSFEECLLRHREILSK